MQAQVGINPREGLQMATSPLMRPMAATILLLLAASQAQAAACFTESPSLVEQGDEYYNLGLRIALSESEQARLRALFARLDGTWQGEAVDTVCKGSDANPRPESRTSSITAEISPDSDHGALLTADKEFDNGVSKHVKLDLLGKTLLSAFVFPTEGPLEFAEKFRNVTEREKKKPAQPPPQNPVTQNPAAQQPAAQAPETDDKGRILSTRVMETIYRIEPSSDTLQITISYYSSGHLAGEETWSLSRR